jgi:DNA-binding MarR family transcriptional regulator
MARATSAMPKQADVRADDLDIPFLCNCTKIRRAARHLTRFYDSCLAGTGVRITQYSILAHLKWQGPMTMADLAALFALDRATIGHNLRVLERDGLVTIKVSREDRRSRIVTVTGAGLECIAAGRPAWDRAQAEFQKLYGEQNASVMRGMMDDVVDCEFSA